jgi:CBS domain-containing protein
MVRNPVWSKPFSDYLKDFRHWVALPDETAHMNVAIFYDARAVAGDAQLLATAKTALIDMIRGEKSTWLISRVPWTPLQHRSDYSTIW